ncbi:MAG: hypothetical protein K2X93_02385 [Candidatus Obscuribacterales bacterium]|nr:hypothetical protein [Candidatus Obscuribacterales bacterium]
MKKYIVIFLLVMCMSTLMGSYSTPPQPMKVGIRDVTTAKTNGNSLDGLIGEFEIADGFRDHTFPGAVTDQKT